LLYQRKGRIIDTNPLLEVRKLLEENLKTNTEKQIEKELIYWHLYYYKELFFEKFKDYPENIFFLILEKINELNNNISNFLFNLLSKINQTNKISIKDILKIIFIIYLTTYIPFRIDFDFRTFIMLLFSNINKNITTEETIKEVVERTKKVVKGGNKKIKKIIRKY